MGPDIEMSAGDAAARAIGAHQFWKQDDALTWVESNTAAGGKRERDRDGGSGFRCAAKQNGYFGQAPHPICKLFLQN